MTIEANGYAVGVRTDGASTTLRLVDELGWNVTGARPTQFDLSIDLGSHRGSKRSIGSVRHGERSVLLSHDSARLSRGADRWVQALTVGPGGAHLRMTNAARRSDGGVVVVPRWVTSDSALMERLVPDARWIDRAWVDLMVVDGAIHAAEFGQPFGPIAALAIDRGAGEFDLGTAARRAAAMLPLMAGAPGDQRLDLACALASGPTAMTAINTADMRVACKTVAELFGI